MEFLIIADSVDSLKPKADTTLVILREALKRGHEVYWATDQDFSFWAGRVRARVQKVESCADGVLPLMQNEKEERDINSFEGVWIRKDPPFDSNYFSLCWLLALEENNVPFLNRPSILLRYHEKMLPFEACERGFLQSSDLVPSLIATGTRHSVPKNFPRGESVIKPWLGHGGKGVEKLAEPQSPKHWQILQPLLPVEKMGDRRVFFLNGERIGDFIRYPAAGKIQANLAQGGKAAMKELSRKELAICEKLGEFLQETGIQFAGVDLLAEKVSEINITSPTGFAALVELNGPRLAVNYLNFAENQL